MNPDPPVIKSFILSSSLDPIRRYGVTDQIPSFQEVGTKVKLIIGLQGLNEQWDLPKVILAVIAADREHRRAPLNYLSGPGQRVKFGSLYVHFYVGWVH